jgi:tRNA (mo5U34)-methyltransferase
MTENDELHQQITRLAPWFHNIHLPDGTQTAPDHFLGDFPAFKWKVLEPYIPQDLSGKTALDIGCNAGFYSVQLARRGARVTAIDLDPHYLEQAEWVTRQFGLEDNITLKQQQVYDLADEEAAYDIVWFMGLFYHLRYPLLALDIISRMTKHMLIFQTLTMPGGEKGYETRHDYSIHERDQMLEQDWPKMAFIEKSFNGDPTNWWFANSSCIEAMLRSCGFGVTARPGEELFICQSDPDHPGVSQSWNESEYLSAIRRNWQDTYQKKVQ